MIKKRFEVLDAFRGLCALSVVISHMYWANSITELDFFKGAGVFVEFFFVLSGFVLAHGYGFKQNLDFKKFMKARFFRLYPLHFTMFFLVFSFQCLKYFVINYSELNFGAEPFTNKYALAEIIPNLMLVQAWTPYTEVFSFNGASWSISIEFYIYVILYVSIISFKSYKIISWLLISILSFILIYLDSDALISYVLRGLSCFFGGAVAYVCYKNISDFRPSYVLGSLGEIFLIIGVIFVVQVDALNKGLICSIIFLFTVLFFALESGLVSEILKHKYFQCLGLLSYSVYMVHGVLFLYLGAVYKVFENVFEVKIRIMIDNIEYTNFGSGFFNNIAVIVTVFLVVFVSNFTYRYIELKGQCLNSKI